MPLTTDETIIDHLKQYGTHCMSYSTLQPEMKFFSLPDLGYIPYMQKWGQTYVLSGCVCAAENKEALMSAFFKEKRKAVFVQIYEEDAALLRDKFGYRISQMGVETWINLKTWNLNGASKALMRRHSNMAKKIGIVIREMRDDEPDTIKDQIAKLKEEWRGRKVTKKQIKFLVRPEEVVEPMTRRFIGIMGEDKLVSYTVCDPLYENGSIMGYSINLTFYAYKIPIPGEEGRVFHGINYYTATEIISIAQNEGLNAITLGLSPLRDLEPTQREHLFMRKILNLVYDYGNRFYSFKGIAQFKNSFHETERKVFFASKSSGLIDILAVMKLSNII